MNSTHYHEKRTKAGFILLVFGALLAFNCNGQEPESEKLAELKERIVSNSYPNIDAVVVSKNDTLRIETYFHGFERDSLHDMRSSFKSVTSLLAGIAIDQRLFSVNDEIHQFIPEWKNDLRGKIKVKDLLQMKSGLACEGFYDIGPDCEAAMWETDDWLKYIFNIPVKHDPGLNWAYSSMEPELVGIIIARTSNMTLMDFAEKYLFGPLKINEYRWFITPNGGGYAGGSFYMKPIDMLKIAQLVLNKGTWQGEQLISEQWINESTDCQIAIAMSFVRFARTKNAKYTTARYGYFWYRERLQYEDIDTELLFASGNGGQYMMILEEYDTVIAFTGSNFGNWRGKLPFDIVLNYIIPMLKDEN